MYDNFATLSSTSSNLNNGKSVDYCNAMLDIEQRGFMSSFWPIVRHRHDIDRLFWREIFMFHVFVSR